MCVVRQEVGFFSIVLDKAWVTSALNGHPMVLLAPWILCLPQLLIALNLRHIRRMEKA